MAYEKVGGARGSIVKWDAVGKSFEGYFMGIKTGKKFAGNAEPSRLLRFIPLAGGDEQTVAATGGLADDMAGVPLGVLVRIEYLGLQKSQSSGREFKAFDIKADRTRTISGQVSQPQAHQPTQPAPAAKGIEALEQALHGNKGAQVAGLMIEALKLKYPDASLYEAELRKLLVAHGVAV